MARVLRLVELVMSCFCQHEWCTRHANRRLFLECLRCGRTTTGVEVGHTMAEL